ncbi:MAG: DUF2783 domain-containing protein [Proteobacteria bacterium]|nr:DUF2783 domain-containing protein [Pseudomonadota bacterium]
MGRLSTEPRITRPDDFYEALIKAHRGLSDEQSRQLNARLILILANQVGDFEVLQQALNLAQEDGVARD